LEELVDKEATERSDAARDAFLAELAKDAEKNANQGGDKKLSHEKSKDKKKMKDSRRSKDPKVVMHLSMVIFCTLLVHN
jgi:hypothetical protein